MKELASSIIWYVHTDVACRYISSDSGLNFQIQPVTLNRSTLDAAILLPPRPPRIQPQYYAAIIAAEAIGNSNNTQVIELNITDPTISGYAFYQDGKLTKVILINSLAYTSTATAERPRRPSKHVNLNFPSGTVPSRMNVKRLFVPYVQFCFFITGKVSIS